MNTCCWVVRKVAESLRLVSNRHVKTAVPCRGGGLLGKGALVIYCWLLVFVQRDAGFEICGEMG